MKLMQTLAVLMIISTIGAMEIDKDFSRYYIQERRPYKILLDHLEKTTANALPVKEFQWSENDIPDPKPDNPSSWLKNILGVNKLKAIRAGKPVKAWEISQEILNGFFSQTFIVEDSTLGTFKVLVLRPPAVNDASPIIIANHGHGGSAESFADRHIIQELAAKNAIVVIPEYRAMLNNYEIKLSQKLFQHNIFLMGVRITECLLSLELVEGLFPGRRKRAMIGHSGGSATALLTSWILGDLEACVIDYQSDFILEWNRLCCEGIPPLKNALTWLYSPSSTEFLMKVFPYNFVPDEEELIRFFQTTLSLKTTNQNWDPAWKKTAILKSFSNLATKNFFASDRSQKKPPYLTELKKEIIKIWKSINLPVEKDTFLLRFLEQTNLNEASDQPVDLYPLLSTSDAKLKFISQFDSIDSLGDGQHALKALEKLQKLVGNYSVGTEQSLFIINAMSKYSAGLSPELILELFHGWKPSSEDLSLSKLGKILHASNSILHKNHSPAKTLKLMPIPNDYKVIIGYQWYKSTLQQKLRTQINTELKNLCLNLPDKPLLPSSVLKTLIFDEFNIPSTIEGSGPISKGAIDYLTEVGRFLIMKGQSVKAASISSWIFDPEVRLSYLDRLASEFEIEDLEKPKPPTMGPLVAALISSIEKIAPEISHLAPYIQSILRFYGLTGNEQQYAVWFKKGFDSFFDDEGQLKGDEQEILTLFNLGAEFDKDNLVQKNLLRITDLSMREHLMKEVFEYSLERKNNSFCAAMAQFEMSPDLKVEFNEKLTELNENQRLIGQKIVEELDQYITQHHIETLNSDLIYDSLNENHSSILRNLISKKIRTLFEHISKEHGRRKRVETILFSLSRIAKMVRDENLYEEISNFLEKKLTTRWPSPGNDLLDGWIMEVIQNHDMKRADRLINLLGSPKLKLKNRIKIASLNGKLTETEAIEIFEELEKLSMGGNQIDIILELLRNKTNPHGIMLILIEKLKALSSQLNPDGKALLGVEIASIFMDHEITYDAHLLIQEALEGPMPQDYKNQIDFLYGSFLVTKQLHLQNLALRSLRRLLKKLALNQQNSNTLLILAGLLRELKEDPFPISLNKVESFKDYWIDHLRMSGPQCVKDLFTEDKRSMNDFENILTLCGLED